MQGNDVTKKEYEISIDPRILELLGPNLYTNIYYVLAELIANSYDAGAHNVYIIEKEDEIIVEDDGQGMSYKEGDIRLYLNVAAENRTTEKDVFVKGTTRRKMGRKGVGKLAALSVSENVSVVTKKNGDESGFILSRHIGEGNKLVALPQKDIVFERIKSAHGTSVKMTKPEYGLHKTPVAIKKNLLKIFPIISTDFKIHIITASGEITVQDFDKEMIQELGSLILLGEDYHGLARYFDPLLEKKEGLKETLLHSREGKETILKMKNRKGEEKEYTLKIVGWIGTYRSTRGRKADRSDFPDNFISLLSNGKLGEFNILPIVGKNRLPEVYVVGQLHIDLFEETELPDIALSNRQGYKSDDPRYDTVISYVRDELLPISIEMWEEYSKYKKAEKEKGKVEKQKADERELKKKLDEYKSDTSAKVAKELEKSANHSLSQSDVEKIIEKELNEASPIIGLKKRVDSQKKRILISQTKKDKPLSDIIYKMLSFNGVPDEDIIYTNADNEGCWIPDGIEVFDYLRDFFVDSISNQKIFVIYVTSKTMASSWGAVAEVGAGWITQSTHRLFNIEGYTPEKPLNTDIEWHNSTLNEEIIEMDSVGFNKFVSKIINICNYLGYPTKTSEDNKKELKRYVTMR